MIIAVNTASGAPPGDHMPATPPVHVMVNLVIDRGDDSLLLVKPDPANSAWTLPGGAVEPFQHPDDAAEDLLVGLGIGDAEMSIANVQSFQSAEGWHLTFDYIVFVDEDPTLAADAATASWFHPDDLPKTIHGDWERDTIYAVVNDDDLSTDS